MTWDGSTSGEPYFWQTSESEYRHVLRGDAPPGRCWCCEQPCDEDDLTRTVDGWSCRTCIDGWWLADTHARRAMDFGGMETR